MNENRTVAKFFAGILMVGACVAGTMAPAQARDTGWDLQAPTHSAPTHSVVKMSDTGWD